MEKGKQKFAPVLKPILENQNEKLKFAVVDIETNDWTDFLLLGHYDAVKKTFVHFDSLEKYLDFLETSDQPENIYAHFGGKFDFLFLIEAIVARQSGVIETIIPRGSSILTFDYITKSRTYRFRDSSALLPFSLKSICESFKVEHNKLDWDHSKRKTITPELILYLKHDCIALAEALESFYSWDLIQKAGPAFTMASQAMRVLRLFLNEEINSLGLNQDVFCRKSYLGGRTEIFKPFCEKGPIYEYDVNSLYPFVMMENAFPVGVGSWTYDYVKGKLGIYEAEIEAPDCYLPCLGIIHDGKFLFPTGKFTGVFTSAELDYAKTKGYRFTVSRGVVFKDSRFIFKKFIGELYKIRESSEKNSVPNLIAKLLMNSSYGRWGMNCEKENVTFDLSEASDEYREIKIDNRSVMLFKKKVDLRTFTHVAVASFVTSYARIHMHKLMDACSDSLFYTDTDSIWTTKKIVKGVGSKIGELKLEAEYESAIFLLPKTYFAKSIDKIKVAAKGFDKKKIKSFTFEDFKTALDGDLRKFKIINEPKFATFKSAVAQKKLVTMTKGSTKQLKSKYNKREIFKSKKGFDTKPIQLNRGEIDGNANAITSR